MPNTTINNVKELTWWLFRRSRLSLRPYHRRKRLFGRLSREPTIKHLCGIWTPFLNHSFHHQTPWAGRWKTTNGYIFSWRQPPAQEAIIQVVKCGHIKSLCSSSRSNCRKAGLKCTDLCNCADYDDLCDNGLIDDVSSELQLLYYRDSVLTYKCFKGLAPKHLVEKLIKRSSIHARHTRKRDLLHIPLYRTASNQRTFAYRGTSIWNNLDNDIKQCVSLQSFKQAIKGQLLEQVFS